jgi:N-acetylglutamate synthase-like GNAT family acetyltransferase
MQYEIISLSKRPELFEAAADWFSARWRVPRQAYLDSMAESQTSKTGVPEWYVIQNGGRIIAGLGVIANDFHKRPDLTPNLCALFVEEPYRKRGLAKGLLDHACEELAAYGIEAAYLITDHTDFYERCGWEFFTMVEEDDGGRARMYQRQTKSEI